MEELIAALLAGAAEIVIEVALQLLGEVLTGLTIRSVQNVAGESRAANAVSAALGYLVLGVGFGALSVLVFPHPLVHPSKVHGISLIVSPVITGLIMSQTGRARRRKHKNVIRLESFGTASLSHLGFPQFASFLFSSPCSGNAKKKNPAEEAGLLSAGE